MNQNVGDGRASNKRSRGRKVIKTPVGPSMMAKALAQQEVFRAFFTNPVVQYFRQGNVKTRLAFSNATRLSRCFSYRKHWMTGFVRGGGVGVCSKSFQYYGQALKLLRQRYGDLYGDSIVMFQIVVACKLSYRTLFPYTVMYILYTLLFYLIKC